MKALSLMSYLLAHPSSTKKSAKQREAARLARRRREDAIVAPTARQAVKKKKLAKKYPAGVKMMGQGWRNLYDALGRNNQK